MKRYHVYRETRTSAGIRRTHAEWYGQIRIWNAVDAATAIENARAAGICGRLVALEVDAEGRLVSERASA